MFKSRKNDKNQKNHGTQVVIGQQINVSSNISDDDSDTESTTTSSTNTTITFINKSTGARGQQTIIGEEYNYYIVDNG